MKNNKQEDVRLLYKGSQRYKGKETKKSNMYLPHELDNIMTVLDNAFLKKRFKGFVPLY